MKSFSFPVMDICAHFPSLPGNLNWDAFVGDVFYSSPVVDVNGRTYVIGYTGGGENHLFAFDPDGTKAWDTNQTDCPFEIGGLVDSSLALSADGKLYYGCFDNRLYCLDVGVGPASSDWPMFQRSSLRDGAWPSYLLEVLISPTGVATSMGKEFTMRVPWLLYPLLILPPGTLSTHGQGEHPVIVTL
jgi:hypothetical protein